ncbi:hypothetical protein [uncultured Legionella sp.]|uniref:hypothetical protein n=1 Tax=uncultured Legionella sp. TaxID=210934 RepID=UPI0026261F23|nr:hypothetical protein [uncultured Legionella sp.]
MERVFRILIVNASLGSRIMLRKQLAKFNVAVNFAWDIDSALELSQNGVYDFVLIDDGFETRTKCPGLIEYLFNNVLNQETLMVVLTYNNQPKFLNKVHYYPNPTNAHAIFNLLEFLTKLNPGLSHDK